MCQLPTARSLTDSFKSEKWFCHASCCRSRDNSFQRTQFSCVSLGHAKLGSASEMKMIYDNSHWYLDFGFSQVSQVGQMDSCQLNSCSNYSNIQIGAATSLFSSRFLPGIISEVERKTAGTGNIRTQASTNGGRNEANQANWKKRSLSPIRFPCIRWRRLYAMSSIFLDKGVNFIAENEPQLAQFMISLFASNQWPLLWPS